MKAEAKKLKEIIQGVRQYIVPLFQRPYIWKKENWETLWEDIEELCKPIEDAQEKEHFMGAIVTMPLSTSSADTSGIAKFLLIDGQQRLITFFVLLATLRYRAVILQKSFPSSQAERLSKEIESVYLVNEYADDKLKVFPTQLQGDRENFQKLIQNGQAFVDGNSNIVKSFEFFGKRIERRTLEEISKLKYAITEGISIVHVELSKTDDPHKIFQTLNNTGQRLSQADLVRNYLLMKLGEYLKTGEQGKNCEEEIEKIYKKYWQPMQERIERVMQKQTLQIRGDGVSEYIRHFLMGRWGYEIRKDNVFSLLQQREKLDSSEAIVAFLADLQEFSTYYEIFLSPDKEPNGRLRQRIERMGTIELTVTYPFLLQIYDDYRRSKLSENDFLEILGILETLIVRYFVCDKPTNGLNHFFPSLYIKAKNATNFEEALKEKLARKVPQDEEFLKSFVSKKFFTPRPQKGFKPPEATLIAKRTKFVLERIEQFISSNSSPSKKPVKVECIMPLGLTDGWKKCLGQQHSPEIHEKFVSMLGNITLLEGEENSFATKGLYFPRNVQDSFTQMKVVLKQSCLALNKDLHNLERWDKEAIKERTERLGQIALKIWPYFGPRFSKISTCDKVQGKTPRTLTIKKRSFKVSTWRDVIQNTLEWIISSSPNVFEQIVETFPNYVGWENHHFRESRQLNNQAYFETNLSAELIYKLCHEFIDIAELGTEEFQIDFI